MDRDRVEVLFRFGHLKPELQIVSRMFYNLAVTIIDSLPMTPERTLSLRALWESKNLAVYVAAEAAEPERKAGE